VAELRFFNPYADIRFTANRLPHWQQSGAVYLVTFRLAGAVPHKLRTQWESERERDGCAFIRNHGPPKSIASIMSGSQVQLNAGSTPVTDLAFCSSPIAQNRESGAALVRRPTPVFVGMPNHTHALFVQDAEWPLEKVLRSWKSFTSRKINSLLHQGESLATGLF
jgi:hypothetical protein